MGLVKTRRLAAMHPPTPAATADRQAAAREGGRKCCQCGNVASSNVANFQLGIGNAKLPNGMLPNCRTDSRQTTEWLLRGVGYFDIMFAT